jgi:hypothetical protein
LVTQADGRAVERGLEMGIVERSTHAFVIGCVQIDLGGSHATVDSLREQGLPKGAKGQALV